MEEKKNFSIRVYAIIINEKQEVMITNENYSGIKMTKFPGGGLEWGEGTLNCLHREAMEEFGQEIVIENHYYTTDFFQPTLFFEPAQLINIYYTAHFKESPRFEIVPANIDPGDAQDGQIIFRWFSLNALTDNTMSFQIDKIVAEKLRKEYT
jgi:8-oxo-dGTP diphosphatase